MGDDRPMFAGGPRHRLGLPSLGDGVGLRGVHFHHLMHTPPSDWGVDWFEIISENFIDNRGYAARVLEIVGLIEIMQIVMRIQRSPCIHISDDVCPCSAAIC
jgi:hypothetical protein